MRHKRDRSGKNASPWRYPLKNAGCHMQPSEADAQARRSPIAATGRRDRRGQETPDTRAIARGLTEAGVKMSGAKNGARLSTKERP